MPLSLVELKQLVQRKNATLPSGRRFNPWGKTRAQIEQFVGASSASPVASGRQNPPPPTPHQTQRASSAISSAIAKKTGANPSKVHALLTTVIQAEITQARQKFSRAGKTPTKKDIRAAAIVGVKKAARLAINLSGGKVASQEKSKKTQPKSQGLTPEQKQKANAVLAQAAQLKAKLKTPKPPKAKTHTDLIAHGAKMLPHELVHELEQIRKSTASHNYEATGKILGELSNELKSVRSGKGDRSESEIVAEARTYKQKQTQYEQSLSKAETLMTQFRQSLINQSPISQKQAESMASKIKIDKNATTAIPEKALRQQSAEFYRLTGGRGSDTIDDFTKDSDRAYAHEGKRVVNIGASGQKSIVFHEMAHHIEFGDNSVGQASLDWIRSRAEGKAQKMKDLTGNPAYKDSEIAYPDHFVSPYVGKVYAYKEDGQVKVKPNTEVVSMGVERLSDPKAMVNFYLKDPEHFKFVLGAIRQ